MSEAVEQTSSGAARCLLPRAGEGAAPGVFGVSPEGDYAAKLRAHYAAARMRMSAPSGAPSMKLLPGIPAIPARIAVRARKGAILTILQIVARDYDCSVAALVGPGRKRACVEARQVAFHLARELTPHTSSEIGAAIRRDHSTVLFGAEKIARRIAEDRIFAARVGGLAAAFRDARAAEPAC